MSNLVKPHGSAELMPLLLDGKAREDELGKAKSLKKVPMTTRETSDLIMLGIGAFTPLPYKVIAISAGLFGYGLLPFILCSVIGRTARFCIIANMTAQYQNPKKVIMLGSLLLALIAVGFFMLG